MRVKTLGLVALALIGVACGTFGGSKTPDGSFHVVGVGSPVDPTLKPARVLPEVVDEKETFGTEPGGGTRVITSGLRIVTSKEGGIVAAEDRFPQAPQHTTALPDRLGGGFLFVLGDAVWRADRWLGQAKPVHKSTQPIVGVVPGLDRVYLKNATTFSAINGKTGEVLDLGPWPASPFVSSYAAADGWRAAAVTDLRGVVATFDAGATWRVLDVPIEARMIVLNGDTLAVGGIENQKGDNAWFDIRVDGSTSRLGIAPAAAKGKTFQATNRYYYGGYYGGGYPGGYYPPQPGGSASAAPPKKDDAPTEDVSAGIRIFGKRPLASAIEDGWPLTDGTVMVARDGAIAKIKVADGTLVEMVPNAFPLKPARCHPVSLTRPTAVGAFGFVCGETRGQTAIYAYDPMKGRLTELKHFDKPRVVTSSGNGAIAVRGGCAEDADVLVSAGTIPKSEVLKPEKDDKDKKKDPKDPKKKDDDKDKKKDDDKKDEKKDPPISEVHPYCILGHDNTWREVHVRGDGSGERIVVLADGKIAVLSPPATQTSPARLTMLDKGKASTVAISYPKVSQDVARVLKYGVWLDGFEERKPGVLGGWIEAGGAMLGLEIALDGKATPGQYVRDAGMPFVSGKYGLGWTSSRRGYETTDGGMTWTGIELPEPITPVSKVERRACGPIGCLAAGWLRVGWGEAKKTPVPAVPAAARLASQSLPIPNPTLACEPLLPAEPAQPPPRVHKDADPKPTPQPYSRRYPSAGVLSPAGGFQGLQDLTGFYGQGPMNLRDADRGLQFEAAELLDRYPRVGSLAKVYAWGPKSGDWETLGKWQVKWLTPFAGWTDVRSSAPVVPPGVIQDFTKSQPGYYGGYYGGGYGNQWQLAPGDDAAHALLITHRMMQNNQFVLFDLEADRAPIEVRRVDGEPFQQIEGIVRTAGRWFLSVPPTGMSTLPTTTVWAIDGGIARELARIPRAMPNEGGVPSVTHLARRSDGRAIGLVVEGQPTNDRNQQIRWVLPIDVETGAFGEPESVGYTDLAGRSLDACTDDMVGWVFDVALSSTSIRLKLPNNQNANIHQTYARLRLTSSRSCMERVTGTFDQSAEQASMLIKAGAPAKQVGNPKPGEIIVTPNVSTTRYALRCTVAPK